MFCAWAALAAFLAGPELAGERPRDPAAAFSAKTLLYMEMNRPPAGLDLIGKMEFWPEALAFFRELAGLSPGGAGPLGIPSAALEAWGGDPRFRSHLQVLAGRRLVVGVTGITEGHLPELVFLCRGEAPGNPLESLAWLVHRITGIQLIPKTDGRQFQLRDGDGKTVLSGRRVGGWLVFGKTGAREEVEQVAGALSPGGTMRASPLVKLEDFQVAMALLPESPFVRGFLNLPGILEGMQNRRASHLVKALLGTAGGIGFAREVERDCIRAWLTGRVLQGESRDPLMNLMNHLSPIGDPLSAGFPADALGTYEVGVQPGEILRALDSLLKVAAPRLHEWIGNHLAEFETTSNRTLERDLFPFLGRNLALAWLPARGLKDGWPLPRPVKLLRVTSGDRVRRFLSSFIQWKADQIGKLTGGLITARVVREEQEGVELLGLELTGIVPFPLPSPTCALVRISPGEKHASAEEFLVASPIRSAVRETVSSLRGTAPGYSLEGAGRILDGAALPGAIELVHLNLKAWEDQWGSFVLPGTYLGALISKHLPPEAAIQVDWEQVIRVGRSLVRFLTALDHVAGATRINERGEFRFCLEWRAH